jgi:hypothetical protein
MLQPAVTGEGNVNAVVLSAGSVSIVMAIAQALYLGSQQSAIESFYFPHRSPKPGERMGTPAQPATTETRLRT